MDQALGASEETAITEEDSIHSVQTVHSWRPEGSRKYGERGNDSDSKDLMHLKLVFADEEKLFNEEYRDRKSQLESGSETCKDFERSVIQNTVIH